MTHRYATIAKLNAAWRTVYNNQTYSSFDEIPLVKLMNRPTIIPGPGSIPGAFGLPRVPAFCPMEASLHVALRQGTRSGNIQNEVYVYR